MLRPSLTHEQFQTFVLEQLKRHYFSKGEIIPILFNQQELAKVWVTDLSKLRPLIQKQYSHRGRPAKDPLCLFRSLLLMRFIGETSIDKWVTKMRAFPLWAIYSGFSPDEVPGAATFYDFQRRLWLNERPYQTYKIRKARRKTKRGTKKGEKAPLQKPGIVQRLVGHFMKHPGDPSKYPYYLLQQILKSCFVLPSAEKGLLGDLENLSVSGDGTSVRTGASRYGKPTCECMKNRVYRCSCPRRFSDPDASWGWDSYRETYYYGRSLYVFTASDSPYDLPVYLNFYYAERHDSACFVPSLFELKHLYSDFKIKECILDSAHDAMAIYQVLRHLDISAIIDLNKRSTGHIQQQGEFTFTPEGIPKCQADHIMAYDGYCKGRGRHKWRCPLTRKKWKVQCDSPCSDSAYGRVFYTYEADNLRYFTRIPRKSKAWKERYKRRTTVERTNKRLKEDYGLENKKRRNTRDWYIEAFLTAMCLHIDAWVKHDGINMTSLIDQWAAPFRQ